MHSQGLKALGYLGRGHDCQKLVSNKELEEKGNQILLKSHFDQTLRLYIRRVCLNTVIVVLELRLVDFHNRSDNKVELHERTTETSQMRLFTTVVLLEYLLISNVAHIDSFADNVVENFLL